MLLLTRRARSRLRSLEYHITDRLAHTHRRIPRRLLSPSHSGSHLALKAQAFLERMASLELMEATNSNRTEATREDGFPRRFTEASSRRTGSRLRGSQDHLSSLLVGQAFQAAQDTESTGNGNDVSIELQRRIESGMCFLMHRSACSFMY